MAHGRKTGGRTAGTPNKKTQEVADLLESLGCNPIEGMVRIAQNEQHTPELRGRMYAELAGYIYPKRKAVEFSGDPNNPVDISLTIADTLRQRREQLARVDLPKELPPPKD